MTNREINEAVARKLGWQLVKSDSARNVYPERWYPPDMDSTKSMNFSGSIEVAWEIVEFICKKPQHTGKILIGENDVTCTFTEWGKHIADTVGYWSAGADTAPLAICLAFLKLDKAGPTPSEPAP